MTEEKQGQRQKQQQQQQQRQKQIPCEDDRKKSKGNDKGKSKSNGNGNGRSRSPAGMTERKARAAARAKGKQGQEQSKGRSGSLLAWSVGPLVLQGWKQVFPCGILFFDEFDFLGARVALEDFFAGYRAADVTEVFEVNQAVDLVTGCMGAGGAFAVGDRSAGKVAGHTGVEVWRAAGKDVDPEVELSALHGREDSRGGREKQIPWVTERKARATARATTEADPLRG